MTHQLQERRRAAPITLTSLNGAAPVAATALLERTLFLRWLCLGTASALVLAALALGGFAAGVSGAPLAVALVIVMATVAVGGLAGVLHWRADGALARGDPGELERLRHDGQLVYYAVALFQVLGMIGALLGYRQQTQWRPYRTARPPCTRSRSGWATG